MRPSYKRHLLVASVIVAILALISGWYAWELMRAVGVDKTSIERAHCLRLPPSSHNTQQKCLGRVFDHGILSMFECDQSEIKDFLGQLKVCSRSGPVTTGTADPRRNGWNVWPKTSKTFVPGNRGLDGLVQTWSGEAKPIEMLSCVSTTGDWLHVELWSVSNHFLIKLYTDWN